MSTDDNREQDVIFSVDPALNRRLIYDDIVRAYRTMDAVPGIRFISDEARRQMAAAFEVSEELLRNAGHQRFIDAFPPGDIACELRLDPASSRQLASMMGFPEAAYDRMVSDATESAEQPAADLVDRIQDLIDEASPFDGKCMRCGNPLDPDGPSLLYCREQCDTAYAECRTEEGFREHWGPDDSRIVAEDGSPLWERRQHMRARANLQVSSVERFGQFADNFTPRPSQARQVVGFRQPTGDVFLVITGSGGIVLWDIERPPAVRELLYGCTVVKLIDVRLDVVMHHFRLWEGRRPSMRSENDQWHTTLLPNCQCVTCDADRAARRWTSQARMAVRSPYAGPAGGNW
jgi:hypothetical protein